MSRTPHDKLFKKIFEQPKQAAAQLRAVLAGPLAAAIDWTSLKAESGSYVDVVLADRYSDLLFSAIAGPERVLLYVLFEHQSTPEPRMALRLLDYMVQIWLRFAQEVKNVGKPLPLIVPVVLSHVPGGWTAATRFSELFATEVVRLGPGALPDFAYAVDDLANLSDVALQSREVSDPVKVALWLLRDARDGDLCSFEVVVDGVFLIGNGNEDSPLFEQCVQLLRETGVFPEETQSVALASRQAD